MADCVSHNVVMFYMELCAWCIFNGWHVSCFQPTFFCKAHEILSKHHHEIAKKLQVPSKNHTEPDKNISLMMRNLKVFTGRKNVRICDTSQAVLRICIGKPCTKPALFPVFQVTCSKLLTNVTSNGDTIPIQNFFEYVIGCIQHYNSLNPWLPPRPVAQLSTDCLSPWYFSKNYIFTHSRAASLWMADSRLL